MSTNSSVSIGEFKVQEIQKRKELANENKFRKSSISRSFEDLEKSSIEILEPVNFKQASP